MATFNKPLKALAIKTLGGTEVTVEDTSSSRAASNALSEFEMFKTMHIVVDDGILLIPFHAVDSILVTSTTAEVTKADPYGCEEEGESGETESGETESGETESGETESGGIS